MSESNLSRATITQMILGMGYVVIRYDFLKIITIQEAAVLEFIIQRSRYLDSEENYNGWIPCANKPILKKLAMSQRTLERVFSSLKEKGFLQIKFKGFPKKRFIRVQLEYLWERVQNPQNEGISSPECGESVPSPAKLAGKPPSPANLAGRYNTHSSYYKKTTLSSKGFPEQKIQNLLGETVESKTSTVDTHLADTLHNIVINVHKVRQRWVRSKWAKEFSILRKEVDAERITKALDWYKDNAKKEYVPICLSAKAFRQKFPKIEAAMTRVVKTKWSNVTVSQTAKDIARELRHLHWPKGSKEQLPAVIQVSLDNLNTFNSRRNSNPLLEWKPKKLKINGRVISGSTPPLVSFAKQMVNLSSMKGQAFIKNWMQSVYDQIHSWDSWSGNLMSFAFSETSSKFHDLGRELATKYCGDPERWDAYIKEISK